MPKPTTSKFFMLIGEGATHAETTQYSDEVAAIAAGQDLAAKDHRPFYLLQAVGKIEVPVGATFTRFEP
jgi:hypothetical protein